MTEESGAPAGVLVSVQRLEVRAGEAGRRVLGPLSVDFAPGSTCAVIGPNGAGKSTLLRAVAGLSRAAAGRVLLGERDVASLDRRAIARLVALLPQRTELPTGFTVREVVAMGRAPWQGAWLRARREDDAAVEAALEACDLGALATRDAAALSGGEQRRVQIARALAQDAPVLLLDEPTAALDVAQAVHVLEVVARAVRDKGLACAMVTHDLNLAAQFATDVLVLSAGAIVAAGAPATALDGATLRATFGPHLYVGTVGTRGSAEGDAPAAVFAPRRRELDPP